MGLLKKLLSKVSLNGSGLISRPDDGLDDWETRDRSLKSLRRHRRRQMDEVEKDVLKRQIRDYEHQRSATLITGKGIITSKRKHGSVGKKQVFYGKGDMIKKSKL